MNTCKRGHEWTPENTYVNPRGCPICRTCKRNADTEARRRQRQRIAQALGSVTEWLRLKS